MGVPCSRVHALQPPSACASGAPNYSEARALRQPSAVHSLEADGLTRRVRRHTHVTQLCPADRGWCEAGAHCPTNVQHASRWHKPRTRRRALCPPPKRTGFAQRLRTIVHDRWRALAEPARARYLSSAGGASALDAADSGRLNCDSCAALASRAIFAFISPVPTGLLFWVGSFPA